MSKINTKRTMNDRILFKRLMKYTVSVKTSFIISFILMVVSVGIDTTLPLFASYLLKILGTSVIQKSEIVLILIGYVLLLGILFVTLYFQSLLLQKAGQRIIYNIREQVFFKIENLGIDQINAQPVGKLVTRVTSDTATLNEMYTNVFIGLIRNILQLVFAFIFMLITSVKLTIITLIIAPLVLGCSVVFRKFSRKAHRAVRKSVSNMNAFLSENISGMKIIQGFTQEDKQLKQFDKCNNDLKKSSLQEIFVFGIFRPTIYVLYISTVTLVLYFGSKDFLNGGIIGYVTIYAFYLYIEKFFQPIQQLAEQFNTLQSALTAAERIFEVIDTVPSILDEPGAIELDKLEGNIEFKNVWFAYEKDDWILKNISFTIKKGQTVAFVGATGSGKTTILSLIVRNYDIQKGEILIDGINIKNIKIASLRQNIGQMLQDVFLFNGSVEENITMFNDQMTTSQIEDASKFVNASHFIERLPNKYQEIVKERGNNFSSGERQLLSFARCIASNPRILILDEATANIDTETEVLIQDSLNKMMNIGTMLVVAHRLSTIQYADNIIVMRKGKIIESGTHQQLLAKGGHYYDLYQSQYRG